MALFLRVSAPALGAGNKLAKRSREAQARRVALRSAQRAAAAKAEALTAAETDELTVFWQAATDTKATSVGDTLPPAQPGGRVAGRYDALKAVGLPTPVT